MISVAAATFAASKFDASSRALTERLGYRNVESDTVSDLLAAFWDAPAMAGRRIALFEPASGEPVYVRLVETPHNADYAPLTTYGWNAAELHVSDVHALADQLDGSEYRILGGPRDLLNNGTVIAMQVCGPSDEVLYLTRIESAKMQQTYGRAKAFVGRTFIVVLGASDHTASLAWYAALSRGTTRPRRMNIRVLAAAHDLHGDDAVFPIAAAILEQRFRIEIDGYPATAAEKSGAAGVLPPGLAMVSFRVDTLDGLPVEPVAEAQALGGRVYAGRPAARLIGPDGEWLELIEAPAV